MYETEVETKLFPQPPSPLPEGLPTSSDSASLGNQLHLETGSSDASLIQNIATPQNKGVDRFPHNLPKKLGLILAQNGATFAVIRENANPYVLPVGGRKLNNIIRSFGHDEGFTLRKSDINEINDHLKAQAETAGVFKNVWYRIAPILDGVEIDLGDETHARIRITADGVQLVTGGSETLFYRTAVSLPLVRPSENGDISLLKKYLNLHPVSMMLFIGWLTYTLAHPKVASTKFVILVLQGGQGSGKSSLCNNILLKLIDPSVVGVQFMPTNIKDLSIAAQNAHVLCYDNIRDIKQFMSDSLCVASTGGSMSTRQLYSDADQQVLHLHVALVLNGLHSFIDQPDLAQRCLPIQLQTIPENNRKSETEIVSEFNADLPAIMRGMFDLISKIFKFLPNAEVTNPERMLDFVRWVAAMEKADDVPVGAYQAAYSDALNQGQLNCIQDNLLASAVMGFSKDYIGSSWSGTPEEFLIQLNKQQALSILRSRDWPQNAIALSKRLLPLQASLFTQGIRVEFSRGKKRNISISLLGEKHDAFDERF